MLQKQVEEILKMKEDQMAVSICGLTLYGRDLHSLRHEMWLNDQVHYSIIIWNWTLYIEAVYKSVYYIWPHFIADNRYVF